MRADLDSGQDREPSRDGPAEGSAGEAAPGPGVPADGLVAAQAPVPGGDPAQAALLANLSAGVRELADLSARYHARAEQREGVIDFLRSELDTLRTGERRGLLRPVLAELCRLRDDLVSQADSLPADFDAAKGASLLRSYADSIELTIEDNGIVAYAPDIGDRFDPRMHRRAGSVPATDEALAGHVAAVRRAGYLDIAANSPIAPAEVTVFARVKPPASAAGETADAETVTAEQTTAGRQGAAEASPEGEQ